MKLNTLTDCLIIKLEAVYDVETTIIASLPDVIDGASSPELKHALTKHLRETEEQERRLIDVFKLLDVNPETTKSEAIRGLVKDTAWVISQEGSPSALDSVIISSAQYIEHYEIAGYRSLIRWANILGLSKVEKLLDKSLREEENADETLAHLAETINTEALKSQSL